MTKVRRYLPQIVSAAMGIMVLLVIPLFYHDAFFDINRAKVSLFQTIVPYFAAVMGLSLLLMPQKSQAFSKYPWLLILPAVLFAFTCLISSALQGFDEATLTGSEGRYGGVFFILSLMGAFLIIAMGRDRGIVLSAAAILSGMIVAVLGIVNALGQDPLHFYENMQTSQLNIFLSTIGHLDFYGTYLLMPTALALGIGIKAKSFLLRLGSTLCGFVMTAGLFCARTDSTWIGMALIAYCLFFLSGEDLDMMKRALIQIAFVIFLLPTMVFVIETYSTRHLVFDGLYRIITLYNGAETAAVFLILAFILSMMKKHSIKAPGFRRLALIGLILILVMIVLMTVAFVYYTGHTTETGPFGIERLFRIDDNYGSRRGYIWTRAMRVFRDAPVVNKIFGVGPEMTRRVTRAYIEDPNEEMISGGIYNDVHSQPLQYLLTLGIVGCVLFVLHFILLFLAAWRYSEEDPILTGLAGAFGAYLTIMLINVAQPILLMTYFGFSGILVSCVAWKRNPNNKASQLQNKQ